MTREEHAKLEMRESRNRDSDRNHSTENSWQFSLEFIHNYWSYQATFIITIVPNFWPPLRVATFLHDTTRYTMNTRHDWQSCIHDWKIHDTIGNRVYTIGKYTTRLAIVYTRLEKYTTRLENTRHDWKIHDTIHGKYTARLISVIRPD